MKITSVEFELRQETNGTYSVVRIDATGSSYVTSQLMHLDSVALFSPTEPLFKEFVEAMKQETSHE